LTDESPLSTRAIAKSLIDSVERARPRLAKIDEALSARHPAPGKWSPREIIGHLIDSAQNNHGRFVRAQLSDDLVFPGYAQNEWVRLQGYNERDWSELVELWARYNVHISHVIERTPSEIATRPRRKHNLHEVAWKTVPADEPATLAYFMADYVGHLEHHLRQIWAATGV
jgi:DinB family protein